MTKPLKSELIGAVPCSNPVSTTFPAQDQVSQHSACLSLPNFCIPIYWYNGVFCPVHSLHLLLKFVFKSCYQYLKVGLVPDNYRYLYVFDAERLFQIDMFLN